MSNPYGISLDREWTEWAAKARVSPTVAAALLLISRSRPLPEIVARLTPGELEQIVGVIGRWPDCFPHGTLAALRSLRATMSRPNHQPASRRPGRINAKSLHGRAHTRGFEHAQSSAASAMPTYGTRNGVTPTMGIAATTAEPVSASTLRVRRHRQRRRDGVRLFTVEVPERLIEQAITRGLLKQEDRAKPWPHCDRCGARSPSRSRLSWCRRASAGVLPAVQ